jgi:flavin reductase (DIM6/NTAB) family NADH-FMN oxidoreductase RutF
MKKSVGARALIVPTPVWVVGTYDREGKPNAMYAAIATRFAHLMPLKLLLMTPQDIILNLEMVKLYDIS